MSPAVGEPDPAVQIAALVFAALLIQPDNRIAQANPAAEDLLGQSDRRLKAVSIQQAIGLADDRVLERLTDPEAPFVARDLTIRAGGAERRVDLTCSPVPGHGGWRMITFSDVRHGDRADADTDRTELRAPAVLAHEIKNPLAAIRGASQLLGRRVAERDRPLAKLIATEVDRIAGIVDRMQRLGSRSHAASGPCNPHQAIRNAMASVRAGRAGQVRLEESFDPSLPPVAADAATLEQILINLLANACDAAAVAPDPVVAVRTRFASGLVFNTIRLGKSTRLPIEITVSDNGAGLDPALRDHVFEPFVTGKPGGQGLGLALVRKLVRDMGGRVAHERDESAGLTHFRIHLPIAEARAA